MDGHTTPKTGDDERRRSRDLLEALSDVPENQRTWKRLLPKATESDPKDRKADKQQPQDQETEVVDLRDLTRQQRQLIVDNALATHEQSNEVLLENAQYLSLSILTSIKDALGHAL
ncbi:MAG: hypothetical protein Q9202_005591 [Teloschistes flavicans]